MDHVDGGGLRRPVGRGRHVDAGVLEGDVQRGGIGGGQGVATGPGRGDRDLPNPFPHRADRLVGRCGGEGGEAVLQQRERLVGAGPHVGGERRGEVLGGQPRPGVLHQRDVHAHQRVRHRPRHRVGRDGPDGLRQLGGDAQQHLPLSRMQRRAGQDHARGGAGPVERLRVAGDPVELPGVGEQRRAERRGQRGRTGGPVAHRLDQPGAERLQPR